MQAFNPVPNTHAPPKAQRWSSALVFLLVAVRSRVVVGGVNDTLRYVIDDCLGNRRRVDPLDQLDLLACTHTAERV